MEAGEGMGETGAGCRRQGCGGGAWAVICKRGVCGVAWGGVGWQGVWGFPNGQAGDVPDEEQHSWMACARHGIAGL